MKDSLIYLSTPKGQFKLTDVLNDDSTLNVGILIQNDIATFKKTNIKLDANHNFTINVTRKLYNMDDYLTKNRDSIIFNSANNSLNIWVGVNTYTSYSHDFTLGNRKIHLIIQRDLQIKTIADTKGIACGCKKSKKLRDEANKDREFMDFPYIEENSNVVSNPDRSINYGKLQLFGTGKLRTNIIADSTNKGILYLNLYKFSNDDPFKNKLGIINCSDTLGQFYNKIRAKRNNGDFIWYIARTYSAWDIGALTVPLKWVLAPSAVKYGNLLTNVNAGVYFGREWGRTRYYINSSKNHNSVTFILSGFINTTALSLTSGNADLYTLSSAPVMSAKPVSGPGTSSATTASALGISYGGGFQIGFKNVDFALLLGLDTPVSQGYNYNWEYTNKVWVGFGISYNVGIFGNGSGSSVNAAGAGTAGGGGGTGSSSPGGHH